MSFPIVHKHKHFVLIVDCPVHRSDTTDRGEHWDSWRYTAPRLPRKQLIRLSSVSAVIVGESDCVLLSTDAGASWRELRVQLADYGRVNTALLDMDGYLLLGTTEGLLRSTNPIIESPSR